MDSYILAKKDLLTWAEVIKKNYNLVIPSRINDELFFSPFDSSLDLGLLGGNAILPYLPPKDFVFPQSEVLFSFSLQNGTQKLEVPEIGKPETVILGIRPCDTKGISWLDKFYQENFKDFYYTRRRENLFLVTVACNQPGKNCFCICCEGGPFLEPEKDEFDLQLIDLDGENYLVEVKSEKGKTLTRLGGAIFSLADIKAQEIRAQLEAKSRQSFYSEPTSYMSYAIRKITENSVPPEVWTELGERCFDDGGCTFVCPCCSCFGVGYLMDEKGKGYHYRFWDSCDYSGFTREVSGHNPRADKGERFKRRFYHKLSYQYVKRDGRIGCVGCGRCITACPGGVGMPAVVERIRTIKAQRNFYSGNK